MWFVRQAMVVTVLLLCTTDKVFAVDSLRVSLHYPIGSAVLDADLDRNARTLEKLQKLADGRVSVHAINIVSSASPEGNTLFNKQLSEDRTRTATALLSGIFELDSIPLTVTSIGIDWDGLTARLGQSEIPYANEAAAIIRNTPEWVVSHGAVTDSRKLKLRRLGDGEAWRCMLDTIFPQLRVSHITIIYHRPLPEISTVSPTKYNLVSHRNYLIDAHPVRNEKVFHAEESKPFDLAVRTNLLYDAFAVPNLGFEIGVGHGWSLGVSGMYAWWSKRERGRYWRIQGVELSAKRYFSGSNMRGHHVGLIGSLFRYDFSFGGKGQLSGGSGASFLDNPSWTVGAEYGYAMKISSRLSLDFSLSVGYMAGRYNTYRIIDGHSVWESTRQRRYFGPVKADISLIYIIRKGGER
ncbi:MAG: DUF3575 domain-containing protein [Muribaculaceae bacterium]|nr:DUF3575 domain-containing protein [Muribaculaceae bacterium]